MISMPTRVLRLFRSSLTSKIFALSFVCIHVPLLAMIAYLGQGMAAADMPLLLLLLAATLAGTAVCLFGLWWLIRPLRQLTKAVDLYWIRGGPLDLPHQGEVGRGGHDEIARLTAAISAMVERMEGAVKHLHQQATTDPLTGLGNRRWLSERVDEEVARSRRQAEPLSVILFDLDLFKAVNDTYGHEVGDGVLVAAGELVRTHLRRYDVAARLGGEEFCVALPRTRRKDALVIAERLRRAFAGMEIPPLPRGEITASFGVYEAASDEDLQSMLSRADQALYEAKNAGRNRVVGAGTAPPA